MPNRLRRFFGLAARQENLSHEVVCANVQPDKDSDDKFSVLLAFSSKLPEDGSVPEWIELLPLGSFDTNADDTRGPFRANGDKVIAATKERGLDRLSIDYDHRTYTASDSRAAGWIRDLKISDGGNALQARIEWTPDAAAAIKKKEYRFVSPVFKCQPDDPDAPEDEVSGDVLFIRGAALTNDPALTMTAILSTARTVTMKGKALKMSEICATLEKAFPKHSPEQIQELATHAASMQQADDDGTNVTNDAEDGDDTGEQMSATNPYGGGETEAQCRTRHAALATERTTKKVVETAEQKGTREAAEALEISAAHERDVQGAARGSELRVTRMTAGDVAKHPMVVKLARQVGDLTAERSKEKAERTVTEALKARKILPSQKEWALAYCSADPAGFETFIGKQVPMVVEQDGSFRGTPPSSSGATVLSAADEQMCQMFGYDREKFAKNKAAFKAGTFVPKVVSIRNDEAAA